MSIYNGLGSHDPTNFVQMYVESFDPIIGRSLALSTPANKDEFGNQPGISSNFASINYYEGTIVSNVSTTNQSNNHVLGLRDTIHFTNHAASGGEPTVVSFDIQFRASSTSNLSFADIAEATAAFSPTAEYATSATSWSYRFNETNENSYDYTATAAITFYGPSASFDVEFFLYENAADSSSASWQSIIDIDMRHYSEDVDLFSDSGNFLNAPKQLPDSIIIFTHGWAGADEIDNPNYLSGLSQAAATRLMESGVTSSQVARLSDADLSLDAVIFGYDWPEAATRDDTPLVSLVTNPQTYLYSFQATQSAGNRLADEIVQFITSIRSQHDSEYDPNIHFVGHSLGSMVNTYAIESINSRSTEITIEQKTILDDPLGVGYQDPIAFSSLLLEMQALGLRDVDFFESRLRPGSVEYVENFYADATLSSSPAFGGPVPGSGPGAHGGVEVSTDHIGIWSDFYSDMIENGNWVTPALPGWTAPFTWPGSGVVPLEADIVGTDRADRLSGTRDSNIILGLKGADWIDGRAGDDKGYGEEGGDTIYGSGGSDELYGGSGRDELFGGAGADVLNGGSGRDTLTGGSGRDRFVFDNLDGIDVITDFQRMDKIELRIADDIITSSLDIYEAIRGRVTGSDLRLQIDNNGVVVGGFKDLVIIENGSSINLNRLISDEIISLF